MDLIDLKQKQATISEAHSSSQSVSQMLKLQEQAEATGNTTMLVTIFQPPSTELADTDGAVVCRCDHLLRTGSHWILVYISTDPIQLPLSSIASILALNATNMRIGIMLAYLCKRPPHSRSILPF